MLMFYLRLNLRTLNLLKRISIPYVPCFVGQMPHHGKRCLTHACKVCYKSCWHFSEYNVFCINVIRVV